MEAEILCRCVSNARLASHAPVAQARLPSLDAIHSMRPSMTFCYPRQFTAYTRRKNNPCYRRCVTYGSNSPSKHDRANHSDRTPSRSQDHLPSAFPPIPGSIRLHLPRRIHIKLNVRCRRGVPTVSRRLLLLWQSCLQLHCQHRLRSRLPSLLSDCLELAYLLAELNCRSDPALLRLCRRRRRLRRSEVRGRLPVRGRVLLQRRRALRRVPGGALLHRWGHCTEAERMSDSES